MNAKWKTYTVVGAMTLVAAKGLKASEAESPPVESGTGNTLDAKTDLQELIRYFREQRAEFLEARRLLLQQLAAAQTPEERRQIMAVFAEQNRDRIRAQAELRRQFRIRQMELRRLRRSGPNPGG